MHHHIPNANEECSPHLHGRPQKGCALMCTQLCSASQPCWLEAAVLPSTLDRAPSQKQCLAAASSPHGRLSDRHRA